MNVIKKNLRAIFWAKSRLFNHAMILGYHRIANPSHDPFSLNVTPENFSEQLEVIKKYAVPVSLNELVKKIEAKKLTERYVAVTFDDGYADNFYRAKPLLEKSNIPATVFITPGKLESEFWWDKLERILISSDIIPEELHLRYKSGSFFWRYNEKGKKDPKWSLFYSLYRLMAGLEDSCIEEILDQLKDLTDDGSGTYKYRTMTIDELQLMTSASLIDAGSHTMSHFNLKLGGADRLQYEIEQSKKMLDELLNRNISGFSYPNGSLTPESDLIVKKCRYQYACVSRSNYIFSGSDKYSLNRFWVPDYNGERFEKWLSGWSN